MTEKLVEKGSQRARYLEIDLIKALAILFMIFVHTYEINAYECFFESPSYENPVLYALNFIIEFFGGVAAAPVFMFCMGVGIVFSGKITPKTLMKRAFVLIGLGLLVNFFEEVLPVVWEEGADMEMFLDWLPGLFANDIYFFFPMTYFLFALMVRSKKEVPIASAVLALGLIGGFILPFMKFETGNTAVDLILGLFVRTGEYAFFPFTSWIVFPMAGYLFGRVLVKTEDKAKLYKKIALISAVALAVIAVVGLSLGFENSFINALDCEDADYYTPNLFSQLWGIAFVLLWEAVAYALVRKANPDSRPARVMIWGSRQVKPIYVLQWVVIFFMTPVLCLTDNIFLTYILCAVVTGITVALTVLWLKLKRGKAKV